MIESNQARNRRQLELMVHAAATSEVLNLLNLRALVSTVTEESPIAAAAKVGLSSIQKKGKSTLAATEMRVGLKIIVIILSAGWLPIKVER